MITHNDRIHITHDEHNTWNLHIRLGKGAEKDHQNLRHLSKRGLGSGFCPNKNFTRNCDKGGGLKL